VRCCTDIDTSRLLLTVEDPESSLCVGQFLGAGWPHFCITVVCHLASKEPHDEFTKNDPKLMACRG